MTTFAPLAAVLGLLLGMARLRVIALLPVLIGAATGVASALVAMGLSGRTTFMAAVITIVGLQVGYFLSILTRLVQAEADHSAEPPDFSLPPRIS